MGARIVILTSLLVASAALGAPKPSEAEYALWVKGIYSDDSAERITSTVELTKHAEHAASALPHLKACLAREEEPGIRGLMLDAIRKIEEATGQAPAAEPSDVKAVAKRLTEIVTELRDADPAAKRRAATALRMLGALAYPALGELKSVAESHEDALTAKTAATALRHIDAELWFHDASPPDKAGDAASIDKQLHTLIAQLTVKLDAEKHTDRLRAIKQLASMEAAAAPALERLHKTALGDDHAAVRRLAGVAIRRINAAKAETEAYYRMAEQGK